MGFEVGEKIYIKAGQTIYKGVITEVLEDGIWLTENEETEEFVSYSDLKTYEWAVE